MDGEEAKEVGGTVGNEATGLAGAVVAVMAGEEGARPRAVPECGVR